MRTHVLGGWVGDEARSALEESLARASNGGAVVWTGGAELPEDAGDLRVLVAGRPTAEQFAACPALEAVVIPFAGVPTATRDVLLDHPRLRLHNLHHNAAPTAEAALGLLLAATRRLVPADRALRADDWRPRTDGTPAMTLDGRTACVLGEGAIGRRVARALLAMGMLVRTVRRRASGHRPADLEPHPRLERLVAADAGAARDAAAGAHALMICLPHTPATDGLVDAVMLDALGEPAVVVNVGRGPIVDETALYERLADGRLFGAGLDTWWAYPTGDEEMASTPPSEHPYGTLDTCVLSPHRGGHERPADEIQRRMGGLAELLGAMAGGERERQRVDVQAGY